MGRDGFAMSRELSLPAGASAWSALPHVLRLRLIACSRASRVLRLAN